MSPALSEFVTTAHSPATDPHLHVWGWEIPVYLFLGGFTAGIMVLSGWALWKGRRNPRPHTTFALASSGLFVNWDGKPVACVSSVKVAINFPPICKLWTSCMPCEDYVGRPITFDASGSSDPDGKIVKVIPGYVLIDTDQNIGTIGDVIRVYRATADGQPIQHKIMEAGGQCGACHGKTAVGFDSCDFCHR